MENELTHFEIIISIIIGSGVFGGLVDFFQNHEKENSWIFEIIKSILFGLCALPLSLSFCK